MYNSPADIQTNAFTFRTGTSDIFTGRGDGSIAVLTQSSGQYADSLVFRDAQLTNPSALQVVGDDIYVTNQGNSMPVVIGFENIFGSGAIGGIGDDLGGSVTNLDSIDAARLSVIATTLASSSNTDDDDDETTEDEAGDAFVVGNNVGLLGSVSLLSLLFAQQSGVEETLDEPTEGEEIETPEWVEFVIGLQAAIDQFRADLLANNSDLEGIDLVDKSLAQLGLWMADSARGLDGWLTALSPPRREFATALLANHHPSEVISLSEPSGSGQNTSNDGSADDGNSCHAELVGAIASGLEVGTDGCDGCLLCLARLAPPQIAARAVSLSDSPVP